MSTNTTDEKIIQEHSSLIHRVVMHCNNPGSVPDMEMVLQQAEANNWTQLVLVIRKLMVGDVEEVNQSSLDHEDRVIINSILIGLKDPATLPVMSVDLSSRMTSFGIAGLIHAANKNNIQAKQLINSVISQLNEKGRDMAILSSHIPAMIEGERNHAKISEEMSDESKTMVTEIIEELLKLDNENN